MMYVPMTVGQLKEILTKFDNDDHVLVFPLDCQKTGAVVDVHYGSDSGPCAGSCTIYTLNYEKDKEENAQGQTQETVSH